MAINAHSHRLAPNP